MTAIIPRVSIAIRRSGMANLNLPAFAVMMVLRCRNRGGRVGHRMIVQCGDRRASDKHCH